MPLVIIVVKFFLDKIGKRFPTKLNYIFVFIQIMGGTALIKDNLKMEKFRVLEIWILYYAKSLIIMIALFTQWKLV